MLKAVWNGYADITQVGPDFVTGSGSWPDVQPISTNVSQPNSKLCQVSEVPFIEKWIKYVIFLWYWNIWKWIFNFLFFNLFFRAYTITRELFYLKMDLAWLRNEKMMINVGNSIMKAVKCFCWWVFMSRTVFSWICHHRSTKFNYGVRRFHVNKLIFCQFFFMKLKILDVNPQL